VELCLEDVKDRGVTINPGMPNVELGRAKKRDTGVLGNKKNINITRKFFQLFTI
jgi:hypothetical protein